ncbi:MAG: adenylate kinase, partial [Pseudomonadota bacterium]
WIIEGFGPMNSLASFNERIAAADTLIYIDLPYWLTYWLVTKRCLKSLFVKPEGWPEGSSVIKGTLVSYRVVGLSRAFWNDDFLRRLETRAAGNTLHVIRSVAELNGFVEKYVA